MKRRLITAALVLVSFVVLASAGAGYYFSSLVITPKVKDYDKTLEMELGYGRFTRAFYDSLPKEEVYIDSPHGYTIHGVYIPVGNSRKTAVFIHGHTYTLMGSYKYVSMFRDRGFNCLLVDNRYHGKTGGKNSTFGYYERHDMKACTDWALSRTGEGGIVGYHGESLGSGIGLMYAAMDQRPAFFILDGPIADLEELLSYRLKKDFGLPSFPLINLASLASRLRGGMFVSDVSPIKEIFRVASPVFYIHGEADAYIPPDHSRRLYEKTLSKKRLWLCPGAEHSKSVIVNRKEYDRQIGLFLSDIGVP